MVFFKTILYYYLNDALEKSRLYESFDKQSLSQVSAGMSLGEGSTYSIELEKRESKSMARKKMNSSKVPSWEEKLSHDFNVSRQDSLVDVLIGSNRGTNKKDFSSTFPIRSKPNDNDLLMNSNAKAQLIAARSRRQEIKDFLKLCANSLHKGPWCRVQQR